MSEKEEFLERWSRRKIDDGADEKAAGLEPEKNADIVAPDLAAEGDAVQTVALDPAGDPDEAPSPVDHIDIDALNYEDDFTVFLQKGVPDRLRRLALRKLWASNPLFDGLDGLNDYDDDFTDAALAVKTLKTAYRVGKGYLDDDELEEEEEKEKDIAEAEADTGDAEETAEVQQAEAGSDDQIDTDIEDEGSGEETAMSEETEPADKGVS